MRRPEINILIVAPDETLQSEVNRLCRDERYALSIERVSSVQEIGDRNFDVCDIIFCSEKTKKAIRQIFRIRNYMLYWVTLPGVPGAEQAQDPAGRTCGFFDDKSLDLKNVLDHVYRVKLDERQRLYECERDARDQVILSVHHNINNALFPIFSSLTKLMRELEDRPEEKLIQHIRMIEKNAAKIKKFVSELK